MNMSWLLPGLLPVLRETRAATSIMHAAIRVSLFTLLAHTMPTLLVVYNADVLPVWLTLDLLVMHTLRNIQL